MRLATIVALLLAVGTLALMAPHPLAAAPAELTPTVVYVPEQYHSGGAYTAIQAGPAGRVYVGTTIYDGYAHFLAFSPATGRFESLAEMSAATGEKTPGPYAQAKIHTKPVISPDGLVYFATKSGKRAADPRWQENYPGGHLLVHDPRANTTRDLGVFKPKVSIIALGVDRQRNLIYLLTDPDSHLVVYDPRARTFADKGQFGPPGDGPTRYLAVLNNGDAFHQYPGLTMARYNAANGTIERLPIAISGGGSYEPPYAIIPVADGRRLIGVGNQSGQVYVFEPRERDIAGRAIGTAGVEGAGGRNVSHYTMALAPDGSVYYTATFGNDLYINRVPAEMTAPQNVGRVAPLGPIPTGYSRTLSRNLLVQGSTFTPDGIYIVMTAYPLRLLVFRGLGPR
jgi:hypothetical protein